MDKLNKINKKLFFRMLKKMCGISLSRQERKLLSALIDRWEGDHADQDKRRLAWALAYVHSEFATSTRSRSEEDVEKTLTDAFAYSEQEWSKVTDAGCDALGNAPTMLALAGMFYFLLLKISPVPLAKVLSDELQATRSGSVSSDDLENVFRDLYDQQLSALCFSGGGIRSATFGLGLVQALARHKRLVNFDYLSTVSGGGYLGSWLSAWVVRAKKNPATSSEAGIESRALGIYRVQNSINCLPVDGKETPNPEPTQLQHLREFSNYMSPRTGLLSADTWSLIAIYLRNLFLNLTIFIPLIAAVLILPRLLYRAYGQPDRGADLQLFMLLGAMIAGSGAVAFVVSRLPSKSTKREEEGSDAEPTSTRFLNTDAGVLVFGVGPLLLAAFLATTLWAWTYRSVISLSKISFLSSDAGIPGYQTLFYFVAGTVVAFFFGLAIFFVLRRRRGFGLWAAAAALLSSVLGGLLLWLTAYQLFPKMAEVHDGIIGDGTNLEWPIYQCLAVPVFLMIVLISATVFVGLTSRRMTDEDREWLARYGAWILIVSTTWICLNVLVLLGPRALEWIFSAEAWNLTSAPGITAILSTVTTIISAIVSLGGGYSARSSVRDEGEKTKWSKFLAVAPRIAAVVFLIAIFVVIAYGTTFLLYQIGHALEGGRLGPFPTSSWHLDVLAASRFGFVTSVWFALLGIGFFMACFVNVNKFSLHGAYRDRLVRAYLGASNPKRKEGTFTGFDDSDNVELHELADQRPFHVINVSVNLVGGKNLAWQNRKAASFVMSPLYCGSWAVGGYRRTVEYASNPRSQKALRLGTAMAISGAAANPNMGYYSSSVVTFLMSLFNIRLGWWLGNTGEIGSDYDWFGRGNQMFYQKSSPSIAVLPLINETLGRTDETRRFLNLSDGGHFENLALYEMALRRCRFILLSDGAADSEFKFGEIANAIQKCKVDLGIDISFLGEMTIRARNVTEADVKRSRFAIAKITYPEGGRPGWLLYTRPAYYKTEPRDILNYADCNKSFPHQSTGDQMYDEKQFEAYRGLGFFTMSEIIERITATLTNRKDNLFDEDLRRLIMAEVDLQEVLERFLGVKTVRD